MNCGFNVVYGYTESDEISLLFPVTKSFNRKLRKLNSILSGEASAKFSLSLGAWLASIAAYRNCLPPIWSWIISAGETKMPIAML